MGERGSRRDRDSDRGMETETGETAESTSVWCWWLNCFERVLSASNFHLGSMYTAVAAYTFATVSLSSLSHIDLIKSAQTAADCGLSQ